MAQNLRLAAMPAQRGVLLAERDHFLRIAIPLHVIGAPRYWWSMIFSENRRPLFGVLL
jgi:hypothetical protein